MDLILEPRVVKGFRFAGVAAGLRKEPGRMDLGVIVADHPVAAAGVFTTNRVKAAPVVVTQEHIRRGRLQAVTDISTISRNTAAGFAPRSPRSRPARWRISRARS
jgi:N-acetylglutamate synthase/N-acetylornithine aminotransferase